MSEPTRLIARLIAQRYLPRQDKDVLQLLTDPGLRQDMETRLASCGLRLLDHPYADHVAIALIRDAEGAVFETDGEWQASNAGLPKDAVALLVLLWALIILPKRERQVSRTDTDGQTEMFGGVAKKPTMEADPAPGISETTLLEDYGRLLGGKARVTQFLLPTLSRLGFIERRQKTIHEGPLLDLAFDYAEMAPRILEGTLSDVLKKREGV